MEMEVRGGRVGGTSILMDKLFKVYGQIFSISNSAIFLFSSPGRSPGRAIVLPPASASALASVLAKSLTLKFFM